MNQLRQTCEKRLLALFSDEDQTCVAFRLHQELQSIERFGHAGAFEKAQRAVQLLKVPGVRCRLIGAGPCSLVSYLLGLSKIDPYQHGLPYERFLESNSSRPLQFHFVAYVPTGIICETQFENQNGFSNTVTFRQSNSLDTVPWQVAHEIRQTNPDFSLNMIPWNDEATFDALRSRNVRGISQLDGAEIHKFLSDLTPRCLTDIAAITAIQTGEVQEPGILNQYMRGELIQDHQQPVPLLVAETLQETRGMILFQEQIMLIFNRVADIPLADAYTFIKAVCKRQWESVATMRDWFLVKADGNGISQADALTLFQKVRDAATRAVCKSHHLSEAVATYRAAFLKVHFPSEFSQILQTIQR